MNRSRLLVFAVILMVVVAAGYAAAVAGLALCSPASLPGDEVWTWRMRLHEALDLTVFGRQRLCFLDSATGGGLVEAARWTAVAVLVLLATAIAWELSGIRLRQTLLGGWGGHAIVAGDERLSRRLAKAESRKGGVLHVALDRAGAHALQRSHPFGEVAVLEDRGDAASVLRRLGIGRARLLVAATGSDLANLALCEAALEAGSRAELLLRLEQPSVRALGSQPLRRQANAQAVTLTSISLTRMQVRGGAALAMPGRYVDERAVRNHVVLCGSGYGVQEAAFHIARQGYGLEKARPLMSVLRSGHTDFAAGALDRLQAASAAIELSLSSVDTSDPLALDRAIAGAVLNGGPPSAVHCLGEHAGEALVLARRWERALLDLDLPAPPIIAYGGREEVVGETGMIRVAGRIDLADAGVLARTMDGRAQLCHQLYLEGQRRARGAMFGSLPAEVEWPLLDEGFQDDNRNVADHMDYKLALAGFTLRRGTGPAAALPDAALDLLAPAEHARWLASRAMAGWRHGGQRDDVMLLHPDMKPYADLDEDARRKDREKIAALPRLLALGGEQLVEERAVGAIPGPDAQVDMAAAARHLLQRRQSQPQEDVIVRLPLDGEAPLALAESLLAAGVAVEVFQDRPVFAIFTESGDPALRRRAAAVLRKARRIRIVNGCMAREAIAAAGPLLIGRQGGVDVQALA